MNEIPLAKVFHLIEPGPVVLLTSSRDGCSNVMTMSWHMMMDFVPPLIGCVISSDNHSFAAVRSTKECVIAIPSVDLASKVVEIGNCSGRNVDKFGTFGLTPVPAETVKSPLIAECFANLECRVVNASQAKRYCLFMVEVVKAWDDPECKERRMIHHNGDGTFVVDGRTINLKDRMVKWQNFL